MPKFSGWRAEFIVILYSGLPFFQSGKFGFQIKKIRKQNFLTADFQIYFKKLICS